MAVSLAFFCDMPLPRAEGRVSARPADAIFLFAQESGGKECAPYCLRPSAIASGNLRRFGCGLRRGTHYAPKALRSNNRGELDYEVRCPAAPDQPAPCAPQAQPQGGR